MLFYLLYRFGRTCWRVALWWTRGALNGISLVKVSDVLPKGGSLLFRDGGLSRRTYQKQPVVSALINTSATLTLEKYIIFLSSSALAEHMPTARAAEPACDRGCLCSRPWKEEETSH